FVPSGGLHTSCGGDTLARRGQLTGTFSFTPRHDNGVFGTIDETIFGTAKIWNAACDPRVGGGGAGPGTPPCPAPPTWVGATDQPDAHTFDSVGLSNTTQYGVLAEAIQQQFYGPMSVMHEIFVWGYPSVHVRDDGSDVRVHTQSPVGLSGDAVATPTGEP